MGVKKRRKNRKKIRVLNKLIDIGVITSIILTISMVGLAIFKIVDINIALNKKTNEIASAYESNINRVLNSNSEVEYGNEITQQVEAKKDNKINYLSINDDINADDAKEIEIMLNNWEFQRTDNNKVVYLTFDDGPSDEITPTILDTLQKNDVKATFFVLGKMIENNNYAKENLKRIALEGHAIGNHGYSHRYDILYPNGVVNVDEFMNDIKKSEQIMKSILGEDFHTRVLRLPGGHVSWDTELIDPVLEEQGYVYIDWNTLNGDAEGHDLSPQNLLERLEETIDALGENNDTLVLLMHDTDAKKTTAEYLQLAIDYLKELGYEFKTIK